VTTLFVIRHGQTDWNRDRRIQGSTDVPLNDTGRRQAHEAATALRSVLPTGSAHVYASDLSRARETAEIIAGELGLGTPRILRELRERSFGEAEGTDVDECLARWGDWHDAQIPGAESWEHLRTRAVRATRRIVRDVRRENAPTPGSALVIAHGGLMRELIRHATAEERPLHGERLENGSAYRFLVEHDNLRLLTFADAPT
jgi:broad specificity phosphatase PhoE